MPRWHPDRTVGPTFLLAPGTIDVHVLCIMKGSSCLHPCNMVHVVSAAELRTMAAGAYTATHYRWPIQVHT